MHSCYCSNLVPNEDLAASMKTSPENEGRFLSISCFGVIDSFKNLGCGYFAVMDFCTDGAALECTKLHMLSVCQSLTTG